MAPSLFFSLLILMMAPCYCIVDPTSTTLAIIQATGIVCGITADTQNRSILCTKFPQSAPESVASFPIGGRRSFDSISGGPNFLCSLRSGDTSFFCWNGIRKGMKRVYHGPTALSQISVGSRHVAAIDGDRRKIRWWSYGCNRHAPSCRHFPKSVSGEYRSLTSGNVFTCAINGTHNVHCWGPHAKSIQRSFYGMYMNSLTAGGGRMCGLNKTGNLICTSNPPDIRSNEDFEFASLAIGSNQTCAIKRKNGTAICWGSHGSYYPMGSTRFEFLVSGGNLTCGLTSDALNVSCWDLNERYPSGVLLSLPKILPGVCVPDEASCSCGVYPDSWDLCGGSGVICKKFDTSTVETCQQFSPIILQNSQAHSQTKWEKLLHKTGLEYALLGVVFGIFCMFSLILMQLGWCSCLGIKRSQNEANLPDSPGPAMPVLENVAVFTFDELRRATKKFTNSSLLGEGGYSNVYIGRFPNGLVAAVKRFNIWFGEQGNNMFRTEIETVYRGRHDNVIKLIGYCTQNHERIIVFERMEKNNLYGHIFPTSRSLRIKSQVFNFWRMRVKILLDAARGIQHLHHNAEARIIHRDIKLSNILIDENWVAKIGDFGLALFGPEPGSEYVTVQRQSGTVEYMDPEYEADRRYAYPRHDVYSFGITILVVLTGIKAPCREDGTTLADDVIPEIRRGNLNAVLDKRLDAPVNGEEIALRKVAEIAQLCVCNSRQRTGMNNVVTALEDALAHFDQTAAPVQAQAEASATASTSASTSQI